MKILKFLAWLMLIMVAIVFVVPLFLPTSVHVSQSITVGADQTRIFRQINNLRNWSNWSPWKSDNPNSTSVFSGPISGKGSMHQWTSEQMGEGSIEILESYPYDSLVSRLDFGNRGSARDYWSVTISGDSTIVRWTFVADSLTYPLGRLNGLVMKWMIRPYQLDGLVHLKQFCENLPPIADVHEIFLDDLTALYRDGLAPKDSLNIAIIAGFRQLIQESGITEKEVTGFPFVVFQNMPYMEVILFRLGLPVDRESTSSRTNVFTHQRGATLLTEYSGPGSHLPFYRADLIEYLHENEHYIEPLFEIWIINPFQVADSLSGTFQLCYPVKP
jgi:effector-binding domain-containing protein